MKIKYIYNKMSQTCFELCQSMISECELSSVEIVGPPSCDTNCDTGCNSDICFTESSGAWTDGPVCSNGTSVCCCEEDCSDYHAEILSEYTGIDKDLVKYVIGGGGLALVILLYRIKRALPYIKKNENKEREDDNKFEDVKSEEKEDKEENIMP